jgi:hypothetical protein
MTSLETLIQLTADTGKNVSVEFAHNGYIINGFVENIGAVGGTGSDPESAAFNALKAAAPSVVVLLDSNDGNGRPLAKTQPFYRPGDADVAHDQLSKLLDADLLGNAVAACIYRADDESLNEVRTIGKLLNDGWEV